MLLSHQQKVTVTSEVSREFQKPPGDGNLGGRERTGPSLGAGDTHRGCERTIKGSHLLSPAGMAWITPRGACPDSSTAPVSPVPSSSLPTSLGSAQCCPKTLGAKRNFQQEAKMQVLDKKNPQTPIWGTLVLLSPAYPGLSPHNSSLKRNKMGKKSEMQGHRAPS